MSLIDRINKQVVEIDLRISRVRATANEEVKELTAKKDALVAAKRVITPEVEAAVAGLDAVGFPL